MARLGYLAAIAALLGLVLAAPAAAARGDVAALQVALRAGGLDPGPVDGVSGPRTRAAVRAFQHRRRLAADGRAGPRTRRALGRRGRPDLGTRAMTPGSVGWDVAALQFLLYERGFAGSAFDGAFGPLTAGAVRRYQGAIGLSADGVAGPATVGALRGGRTVIRNVSGSPVRFLRPVGGRWTDGFGFVAGRRHTGLDFPLGYGAPVGAAGRGTVIFAGHNLGGYGNLVVVAHRLGYETWYAHLSRITTYAGQAVAGGSILGRVGSTGRSTGPHLHFEARRLGTPIDPVPQLLGARSARRPAVAGCRPNADARNARDADPPLARLDRCP